MFLLRARRPALFNRQISGQMTGRPALGRPCGWRCPDHLPASPQRLAGSTGPAGLTGRYGPAIACDDARWQQLAATDTADDVRHVMVEGPSVGIAPADEQGPRSRGHCAAGMAKRCGGALLFGRRPGTAARRRNIRVMSVSWSARRQNAPPRPVRWQARRSAGRR